MPVTVIAANSPPFPAPADQWLPIVRRDFGHGGLSVWAPDERIAQDNSNAFANGVQGEFGAGSPIGPLIHRVIGRLNAEGWSLNAKDRSRKAEC